MATVSTSLAAGTSNLGISGLASGFDWQSLISQLAEVERAPERMLQSQQARIQQQNHALTSIKTELAVLQNSLATLKEPSFFDTRLATLSDPKLASASAGAGAALGTYAFNVEHLATAAAWQGAAGAAAALDLSQALSAQPLATAITAGTFTLNGRQFTIATGDTLQSVFDQINNAGLGVTASYSATEDKITLAGGGGIVAGSATDSSNFLQVTRLSSGTGSVSSSARLATVRLTDALAQSNLAAPITDNGSGDGVFKINGVEIHFNAATDSLGDVLRRINESSAGVTAGYDAWNNRFTLTNKTTGDVGISVEEVSGTFLTATGLAGGALARGSNLVYSLNDGPSLYSLSNTITGDSSGVAGLSVTVQEGGAFKVTVASDTAKIKTAITSFVTEYNKVQALINTETASTTDAKGKVTAGLLAGDAETARLNSTLRDLMNVSVAGLNGALQRLANLGFDSNGHDDSLSMADLSGLDSALANHLPGLKDLFTKTGNGVAVQLDKFLTATIGENGSLVTEQSNLTKQSKDIDEQISRIEAQVLVYQDRLTQEFIAMETAQSQINNQLQYLQRTLAGLSSSSGNNKS